MARNAGVSKRDRLSCFRTRIATRIYDAATAMMSRSAVLVQTHDIILFRARVRMMMPMARIDDLCTQAACRVFVQELPRFYITPHGTAATK